MGYTLYWNYHRVLPNVFQRFVKVASELIAYPLNTSETTCTMVVPDEDRCEAFYISQYHAGFNFCKTRQLPYTKDVAICMILMYEFGLADDLSIDDDISVFLEPLEEVNQRHPLTSYEELKTIFTSDI